MLRMIDVSAKFLAWLTSKDIFDVIQLLPLTVTQLLLPFTVDLSRRISDIMSNQFHEVEMGSLIPLVFTTFRGMGSTATTTTTTTVYKTVFCEAL